MTCCSNNEADQGVWLDTVTVCTSLATLKRTGHTAFCGLKLIIILTCYTFYFTTFELKKRFQLVCPTYRSSEITQSLLGNRHRKMNAKIYRRHLHTLEEGQ